MKVRIGDVSQLQFGLYAKPIEHGSVAYLQAKHFDDWGNQTNELDTFIQFDQKNEAHLLEDGDILLAGKGMRNFAWTYHKDFGPAMASSIFFVIKPDRTKVLPEFLTTIFNMPQTQEHFQILGSGSSIPSIRKSELEAFTVKLPSLELQEKAIGIKQLHYKDMDLSKKILSEKQRVYQAVIKNIIYQQHDE
ncbi:restriction endonuclease subunit S [Reichenbachiella sp.]|uniref:restriction endonuclease subunit S n=1 Tax=Reichenbachiella sp. TaxID=2184521 RepID=UPI0032974EA4